MLRCRSRSAAPALETAAVHRALGVLRVLADSKVYPLDGWEWQQVTIMAVCGNTPVIPVLRRLRQGEWQFEASMSSVARSCLKKKKKRPSGQVFPMWDILFWVFLVFWSLFKWENGQNFLFLLFWATYYSPGWFWAYCLQSAFSSASTSRLPQYWDH